MLTLHYARMNCLRFAETLEELARQAEQARGKPGRLDKLRGEGGL